MNLPLVVSDRLFLNVKDNTWKVVKGGRERYLKLLARTILDPYEIWQGSEARGDGRLVPVLNLIRLFTDGEQRVGGFAVFKLYGRTLSGATVFPPNPGNEAAMLHYLEKQHLELAGRGGCGSTASLEKKNPGRTGPPGPAAPLHRSPPGRGSKYAAEKKNRARGKGSQERGKGGHV